jgi:signal peptidase II
MRSLNIWLAAFLLVVGTIGCDRATKHLAAVNLDGAPAQSFLADTVRLQYAENTGGFLSLGASLPAPVRLVIFTLAPALVLIAAIVMAVRDRWTGPALFGLSLFLAGGASNLIDRATRGSVIDFMNVGVGPLRTGIFNVADVAVLMGLALLVFARAGGSKSLNL